MPAIASTATLDFVRRHRQGDVRQLAFQADKHPEVDMPWALDQIRGWQMARTKLPTWAACDDIVYPPHLSMEQCSSEATALYKRHIVEEWLKKGGFSALSLIDLTGGFGVDFSYLAPLFEHATYVERLDHLCTTAQHNFQALGLTHTTVKNGDSIDVLAETSPVTAIYLDPARRDEHGRKTYSIKDCTPDVAQLCPRLLDKCDVLIVKLSPMLDWHEAVRELRDVREVHIVSTANECKELLLVCSARGQGLRVVCVNDGQEFAWEVAEERGSRRLMNSPSTQSTQSHLSPSLSGLLLTPNASVQKAGCFAELAEAFALTALSPNSHLFLPTENSDETAIFERFPGRIFTITDSCSLNKKEVKRALSGIDRANIAVRNFPLSVDQLRKRLKLKDGGDTYIFATTAGKDRHILIITKKRR